MRPEFAPPATRFLKKCVDKKLKRALQDAVDDILVNPAIGTPKSGDLAGLYGYDVFYNRTNYEIAYMIKDDTVIFFIMIGTRENFYKELKNYIR